MAALKWLILWMGLLNLPAMACPDYLIDETFLVNILKQNIAGGILTNPGVSIEPNETCSIKMTGTTPFGEVSGCTRPIHKDFGVGLAAFTVEIAGQQLPVESSVVDIRAEIKKHCSKELKIRDLQISKNQIKIIFAEPPKLIQKRRAAMQTKLD